MRPGGVAAPPAPPRPAAPTLFDQGVTTMSVSAIVMMIVAIVTVWGGLAAAIVNIARHPENPED